MMAQKEMFERLMVKLPMDSSYSWLPLRAYLDDNSDR